MKAMLIAVIWVDLLACAWIALQFPLIKMSTPNAVRAIEEHFLAPDLSEEERSQFASLKRFIEGNEAATTRSLENTRIGAVLIGCLLLFQNLVLVSYLRTKKGAEPREQAEVSTRS